MGKSKGGEKVSIHDLSIDIETRSGEDLSKVGVYKYVEDPEWEIQLFSYSVNGGDVRQVDLAMGEVVPQEILEALTDKNVRKFAYNCTFERVNLSQYIGLPSGEYIDPESWYDTMIMAAYNGLPQSLEDAGKALKIEAAKMKEGKALIKLFAMPKGDRSDGKRWTKPSDAPEKWGIYKSYNIRDVEAEEEIRKRLDSYMPPQSVWKEYWDNERINDRGIRVDKQLIKSAIRIDEKCFESLMEEMKKITGLSNPNSPAQLKEWLTEHGVEVNTLGKDTVKELLEKDGIPSEVRRLLKLRLMAAKSSVKKYQAMDGAVCSDGRIRGMFRFYGAGRTGRFCLTGDHEVLTQDGWVRLDQWNGGIIACWNPTSEALSFQKAEALSFDYSGEMYTYKDARIDQCSTPDHKMRVQKRDGEWVDMTAGEMAKTRVGIPMYGYHYHRGCANPAWLRVLIMTQADGFYTPDGIIHFGFKKERKIERCKMLLRKAEISFVVSKYRDGVTRITIPARMVPLWLRQFRTKTFGYWLLDENPDIFFDELPNWDGYYPAPNSIQYVTCNKQNADIVQALAHMSGRCAVMRVKKNSKRNVNWNDAYILDIWLTPGASHELKVKPEVNEYKGKVYCASTTTGYFLVRRNGRVWITGNSGKIVQFQNLPRNSMPDLDEARELVRRGDFDALSALYEDVPDVLSQLIRTALIPEEGHLFAVADYSAIEARVLAWLAGEEWVLEAFANGEDIYCVTASKMFGVKVEKHGENAELRAKGKRATLSCGYQGGVGALINMGALSSGMKEEELRPLVDYWRSANPRIVRFWHDIEKAAMKAVRENTSTKVRGIRISVTNGMMFISLPSGRRLSYPSPRIGKNRFGSDSITFLSGKTWMRVETFGGSLVENLTQAVARDLLTSSLRLLSSYKVVGHIHDEVIVEVPEAEAEKGLREIENLMATNPSWAKGLPLKADGYVCGSYRKM